MKTKNKLTNVVRILMVLVFVTSCGSDDNNAPDTISEPDPAEENKPPETFNLIAVADGEVNVEVKPVFTWETANDPDGDAVVYDVYIDVKNPPEALYSENLSTVNFETTERLEVSNDYYWRVVAKDDKGNHTESTIHSFKTRDLRIPDEPITLNAIFNGRQEASVVAFDNKLWVIGGYDGQRLNDVWYSENGENWVETTTSTPFSRRQEHSAVVFDDKIWVIGGYDGDYNNEVWSSVDGENWTQTIANAQLSGRTEHTSVVFDGKMWVIGGQGNAQRLNDVWYSEDGENWTQAISNAPFSKRNSHTSVVFDNKIWVIGGYDGDYNNDVWVSEDGVGWNQVITEPIFDKRAGHTSVVFDNKIWLFGGDTPDGFFNDIWYSVNGTEWKQTTNNAVFFKRFGHTSTVFKEKVWIIGGYDENVYLNDIWVFD